MNGVSIVKTGFVVLKSKWGEQVLKGLTGWKLVRLTLGN